MQTPDTLLLIRQRLQALLRGLTTNRRCLLVPVVPDRPPPPSGHFHTLPELFLQVGGTTEFTLPWCRFRLRAGQACLLPAYTPHKERFFHNPGPFHFVVGMFDNDAITWLHAVLNPSGNLRSFPHITCHFQDMPRLIRLLIETSLIRSSQTRYGSLQLRGAGLLTVAVLLEAMEHARHEAIQEHPKVAFCKHTIHTTLHQNDLCVKTLARRMTCSPNYLSTLFHRHTGSRITEFINARRLERVKDLLLNSTLNISEIARICGYADPSYMTRLFVAAHRTSPRSYRVRQGR